MAIVHLQYRSIDSHKSKPPGKASLLSGNVPEEKWFYKTCSTIQMSLFHLPLPYNYLLPTRH
jgi:hypothetical protein